MASVESTVVKLIAHRGFAAEAPENTVGALERAARRGADAVEFDVRRCGSGESVVIHDAQVDRVTDAEGRVADVTARELAELDVLGSGEGVPTLSAALAAVPPAVGVNAEFKEPVVDAALPPLADAPNEVLVSSFDPRVIESVREHDPGVATALLRTGDAGPAAAVERAVSLGCSAIHPEVDLALAGDAVAAAHREGLAVNAWTVETARTAADLRSAGVDGVIADRSDVV